MVSVAEAASKICTPEEQEACAMHRSVLARTHTHELQEVNIW